VSPTDLPVGLLSRIEDAGLNASAPPPQQRWVEGWLVRFSPGKAQRARCINALAPSCLSLSEKLAYCQALYRTAGLRLLFRITPFSQPTGGWTTGWPSAATSASRTPASWSARAYPVTRKSHHQKTLDSRASIQKCMLTSLESSEVRPRLGGRPMPSA
jgi:hypothetical protein